VQKPNIREFPSNLCVMDSRQILITSASGNGGSMSFRRGTSTDQVKKIVSREESIDDICVEEDIESVSDCDRNDKDNKMFNDFKVNSSRNNELFS
jgi:hypothetical protein